MKFIVFLNGLLLLFLLHHWTESVEEPKMNLTTLARIIDFFEQNYKDTKKESYAVAINVPMNQCQGNFDPSNKNFLTLEENATSVRNAIYNTENQFYKGTDLMAAGPCNCTCKKIENCENNSVFVLLQNDSCLTFKNFLQRRENDSCVVIYTVYSPGKNKSCGYDIAPNLENLKNHAGIKAFVFKKVDGIGYRCSDLPKAFTESLVPFYLFVNKTVITNECQHALQINNFVKE